MSLAEFPADVDGIRSGASGEGGKSTDRCLVPETRPVAASGNLDGGGRLDRAGIGGPDSSARRCPGEPGYRQRRRRPGRTPSSPEARDGTLRGWSAQTGRSLAAYQTSTGWITRVAFSPDGWRVATQQRLRHRRRQDLGHVCSREALSFKVGSGMIERVTFSPDGRRLATSGWDGTVRLIGRLHRPRSAGPSRPQRPRLGSQLQPDRRRPRLGQRRRQGLALERQPSGSRSPGRRIEPTCARTGFLSSAHHLPPARDAGGRRGRRGRDTACGPRRRGSRQVLDYERFRRAPGGNWRGVP